MLGFVNLSVGMPVRENLPMAGGTLAKTSCIDVDYHHTSIAGGERIWLGFSPRILLVPVGSKCNDFPCGKQPK